jgi:hypothetical protein
MKEEYYITEMREAKKSQKYITTSNRYVMGTTYEITFKLSIIGKRVQ